jgi:hypothetical protein
MASIIGFPTTICPLHSNPIVNMNTFLFPVLILLTACMSSSCADKKKDSSTEQSTPSPTKCGAPARQSSNLVIIGTAAETTYVQPTVLFDWLATHKPGTFKQGQACICKVDDTVIAVSAPHVVETPGWAHPLARSAGIGNWIPSSDGKEISFAKVSNPIEAGFCGEIASAAQAQPGRTAEVIAWCFDPSVSDVVRIEMKGVLELITDRAGIAGMVALFNEKSAFRDRLARRAPTTPVLVMQVAEEYRKRMEGMSGALVWQGENPVGVFVACVIHPAAPPFGVIEPLLDSAQSMLAKIR